MSDDFFKRQDDLLTRLKAQADQPIEFLPKKIPPKPSRIVRTPLNKAHTVGSCTFYTYPCKYEDQCARYTPDLTLPVKIKCSPDEYKTIQRLNPCTHGGGVTCKGWKISTNRQISKGVIQH